MKVQLFFLAVICTSAYAGLVSYNRYNGYNGVQVVMNRGVGFGVAGGVLGHGSNYGYHPYGYNNQGYNGHNGGYNGYNGGYNGNHGYNSHPGYYGYNGYNGHNGANYHGNAPFVSGYGNNNYGYNYAH